MKARPIIRITLLTLCLFALAIGSGCELFEGSQPNGAEGSAQRNASDSRQVSQGQKDVEAANETAKRDNEALQAAKSELTTPKSAEDGERAKRKIDDLETKATESAARASKLQQALEKSDKASRGTSAEVEQISTVVPWSDYFPSLGSILIGFFALLVVGGLGYIAKIVSDSSRRRTDARFRGVMKRQEELAVQVKDSVTSLAQGVNSHLADVLSEIGNLRRSLQDDNRVILDGVRRTGAAMATPYSGSYQGFTAPAATMIREEPTFPTSVEEYLVKVKRGALIVKPDFQNGILVQDSDNSGEFMLVRDHLVLDELLYVIPRVSYFQTKQDFYNYYDKYYDCQHPSAGTIWILRPAVVDRIGGGWTLREKGELEVR